MSSRRCFRRGFRTWPAIRNRTLSAGPCKASQERSDVRESHTSLPAGSTQECRARRGDGAERLAAPGRNSVLGRLGARCGHRHSKLSRRAAIGGRKDPPDGHRAISTAPGGPGGKSSASASADCAAAGGFARPGRASPHAGFDGDRIRRRATHFNRGKRRCFRRRCFRRKARDRNSPPRADPLSESAGESAGSCSSLASDCTGSGRSADCGRAGSGGCSNSGDRAGSGRRFAGASSRSGSRVRRHCRRGRPSGRSRSRARLFAEACSAASLTGK